jgi:ABC-type enterochelin transport system permease subunit
MIAMMIGLIFAFLFQCVPISNNWKYVGNEGCVDIAALYIGGICLNTFTDGRFLSGT